MVDRFRRTKLLGKGGFGKVYEAIDTLTGETVALKELFGNFTTFAECKNMPEVKAL